MTAGPEERLRTLWEGGDLAGCATAALTSYGGEIHGWLIAVARDRGDADEAFAELCEDMWRALPGFRWQSTLRTWAYALARQALVHVRRHPAAKARRRVALSEAPEVWRLAEQIRSATPLHLRSEVKSDVAALREALDPDEQALLILRIDRDMSWDEVAEVIGDTDPATLRKRYERIKRKLREAARALKHAD